MLLIVLECVTGDPTGDAFIGSRRVGGLEAGVGATKIVVVEGIDHRQDALVTESEVGEDIGDRHRRVPLADGVVDLVG